jgi:hypothetical protein
VKLNGVKLLMTLDINFLFLNLNAVVTFFLAFIILYFLLIERLEKHVFYYSWSIGFILYATQMVVRANNLFPVLPAMSFLMVSALIFFLWGLWSLSKRKDILYIVILVLIALGALSIIYLLGFVSLDLAMGLGSAVWYLPIVVGILRQRMIFGKNVDKFAVGWLLLFLSNLLLLDRGWIGDFFGITSKLIILVGTLDYDFVILIERIQRNINSGLPPIYTGDYQEGGMRLVIQNVASKKSKNADWIFKKVEENTENDRYTYFFAFQDVTSHDYLRKLKWINPERVIIFLFSNSASKVRDEFTVIPMGITQIGATLSEIIKRSETNQKSRSDQRSVVIFDNLSLLVHSFGVHQVYNLLLDKMGALRTNRIELFAIFQPETHNDESITPLFKSISDEIIDL